MNCRLGSRHIVNDLYFCFVEDAATIGTVLDPELSERRLLTMPPLKSVMGGEYL